MVASGVHVGNLIRVVGVGRSVGDGTEVGEALKVGDAGKTEVSIYETGITVSVSVVGKKVLEISGQIITPKPTIIRAVMKTKPPRISF
jgi:hypothetical protein